MRKNYTLLTNNIRSKKNPEGLILEKAFQAELSTISKSDILVFIRTAMNGVEPEYTAKSIEAGEKVKEHLKSVLSDVDYKYQGSVMTNTHIKGYSDIDLLAITNKFYTRDISRVKQILENYDQRQMFNDVSIRKLESESNLGFYHGDSLNDLLVNRLESERKMHETYKDCSSEQPKAIKIRNLSLHREVDIVIANWYDDVRSIINNKGENRGVQIYNKEEHTKGQANYPFLSISRINDKSALTKGRLKKMIRFLKHCKAESLYQIGLTSFDINAICYAIEVQDYADLSFYDLVPVLYLQLKRISGDSNYANSLMSVDGREYIFKYDSEKRENLKQMLVEVEGIYLDLLESKKAII
ncbi:MAG TPA: hypothetical protein VFD78_02625 [Chitinophagaceae bacterium]|nr:hypothetical protein [Chitinophagaceae bacterium]